MGLRWELLIGQTTETDEKRCQKPLELLMEVFLNIRKKEGFNIPHLVISVDNIEEAMKTVRENGGKNYCGASWAWKIDEIPGVGRYISV